jgi:hypothetical protein
MNNQVLPAGSRVRVISYGPFRGLKGTIRKVDTIPGLEAGETFCFYLVELEGTHTREPVWFACDEVELVDCQSSDDERDLAGSLASARV